MTIPTKKEFCAGNKKTIAILRKHQNASTVVPGMIYVLEKLVKWEKGGDEHDMDHILAETHALLKIINEKGSLT